MKMNSMQEKILFLADHLGYGNDVVHGATTYYLNVIPGLIQSGVDVIPCFLRQYHISAKMLESRGINSFFLNSSPYDPFVVLRIAWIVYKYHCTIIHAHGIKATSVARVIAKLMKRRVVLHIHDQLLPNKLLRLIHLLFSQPNDLCICVTEELIENAINGYGMFRNRIRVLHNGIRIEDYRSPDRGQKIRETLRISEGNVVFGMIGRFYPVKGHRKMIKMMTKIVASCPKTILLMIGDGPERPECESMVQKFAINDHVRFLGQRSDVPQLLSMMDIVVIPSESEGLSYVAVESVAAGKPIVAYDCGGMKEIVRDKFNGSLVDCQNNFSFIEAVISLTNDYELRKKYSENTKKIAEMFNLEDHITKLKNIYSEVLMLV